MNTIIRCECLDCESNKDGSCEEECGITIGSDGACEEYFEGKQ